jgi:hypothetical protein
MQSTNLRFVSKSLPSRNMSLDNAVGLATDYGHDGQGVGVRVPVELRIFYSPRCPDLLWGQPSLLSNGYKDPFCGGAKRPGPESDHSCPTSAEVKKM